MDPLPPVLVVVFLVVVAWALIVIAIWRAAPSEATVVDLVRLLPDVLRLAARLARDPGTPRSSRLALTGLAIWIASPIDLIPEFIPVVGPLDDIVVAAIVLRWVGRRSVRMRSGPTGPARRKGSDSCCACSGDPRPSRLARLLAHRPGH